MSTTDIAVASSAIEVPEAPEVHLSNRDLDLIRRQVPVPKNGRPPNDVELEDFARYCMAQRLNPFDRQIYLAHIAGRWQPFVGVHGRLAIAFRSGQVAGMEGPFFCRARVGVERDQPAFWDELWDGDGPPHAAKFVVWRKGMTVAPRGIARWAEYGKDQGPWKTMPSLMLGYKAITRALNLSVPDVLPPAPEHDGDDPDLDESQGYRRDETVAASPTTSAHPGAMIDGRGLASELGLTAGAVLLALRRIAGDLGVQPPTALDSVSADLVEALRADRAAVAVDVDGVEEPF